MTVTAQTNTTLEEIASVLLKHGSICVCGHTNPDGDCIGSTLALARALRAVGKDVVTLVADDGPVDDAFAFMAGFDGLAPASSFDGPCEAFVAVDAPNDERLGPAGCALRDRSALTVTIDHHAAPAAMSDLSYTDPDAAATTLLVWRLAGLLGLSADDPAWRDVAECAYAGLLTDTGRFMFQNTDSASLRAAAQMLDAGACPSRIAQRLFQEKSLAAVRLDALAADHMRIVADGKAALSWISIDDMTAVGARKADSESAVNVIRSIRGIEVACMLKEREDCIRGSLRAKGPVDVASLARKLGGGGHVAAAGFTLHCSLDEALELMQDALERLLS